MPRIRPSPPLTVVGGSSGGSGIPDGAAVMTDAISLFAVVQLFDSNATPSDAGSTIQLAATYTETNAGRTEALNVSVNAADTIAGRTETLRVNVRQSDSNAGQTEALALALSGYSETQAAPSDAVKVGASGYADSNATPTETRSVTTETWATTQSTSGTAPTNPTNALGQNNGTVAQVKAGGLANGTSGLVNTIPVASIPAGGTKTLRLWYSVTAGATDTFTVTYTNTGGSPASGTLPNTGNFLTTPHEVALTTIGSSLTVSFTHAASVPATGGNIQVDATGVRSVGAF